MKLRESTVLESMTTGDMLRRRISRRQLRRPGSPTISSWVLGLVRSHRLLRSPRLTLRIPFSSMCTLREELLASLAEIRPTTASLPLYSTVTGQRTAGPELDAAYWFRNVREPVLFAPAIEAMVRDGAEGFVELSPHPVLSSGVEEVLAASGRDGVVVASLRRKTDDQASLAEALMARLISLSPVVDLDGPRR